MAMSSGRWVACAIALASLAPASALAADSAIEAASYHPRLKVVVIPYRGQLPAYTLHELSNPPRVYLDLKARAFTGPRTQEVAGHPSLLRFSMAPRGQAEARVTLTFKAPTKIRVVHNAKKKLLLLVPATGEAAAPRQAAKPAALGQPRYDAARGAIVLPLTGAMPAFRQATLPDPPRVYVDFQARGPEGLVRGEGDRVRWTMAGRGPGTTRLTLTFQQQTPVQVRHDAQRHEILLLPTFPSPAPGAPSLKAIEATPALEIEPATGEAPASP